MIKTLAHFWIYLPTVFLIALVLISLVNKFIVKKSKTTIDDIFFNKRLRECLMILIPLFSVKSFINPKLAINSPSIFRWLDICIIIFCTLLIHSIISSAVTVYGQLKISKHRPIKGYAQLLTIFLWISAIIFLTATITGKSPWGLFGALGGLSAVLMLIFKDTILSLVASFQLTANKLIRIGDWIVVPGKCDGDVIDITLHTVKVQNFDKTISTVPTCSLISDSFTNWRGMAESNGRRIKRAINIDMKSVGFCSPEMIEKLKHFNLLKDYLKDKLTEIEDSNQKILEDGNIPVNQRCITNLGTFRAYIERYLQANPVINKDLTLIVRQLAPTPQGMPIEIYCFSSDKVWANYEAIQADIFDHLLAIIHEFDLKVFQEPTHIGVEQ